MIPSDIQDAELRAIFERIAAMTELELKALGLNSTTRDRLLEGIVVSENPNACWRWTGAFLSTGKKPRPVIYQKGKAFLAYRV